MSQFAIGKLAYGFCERCGLRYDLREFKAEMVKGNSKNNRVCPDCWDPDHPQNFIGTYRIEDPQGLKRPVPELGTDSINSFLPVTVRLNSILMVQVLSIDIGFVSIST